LEQQGFVTMDLVAYCVLESIRPATRGSFDQGIANTMINHSALLPGLQNERIFNYFYFITSKGIHPFFTLAPKRTRRCTYVRKYSSTAPLVDRSIEMGVDVTLLLWGDILQLSSLDIDGNWVFHYEWVPFAIGCSFAALLGVSSFISSCLIVPFSLGPLISVSSVAPCERIG